MQETEILTDRNGMVALSQEQCMERLGRNGIGRVAVTTGALPALFPINYAIARGNVYFRTAPGTKLAAASRNAVVAFEADHADPMWHTGWSVMIVGRAEEVVDPEELQVLRCMPLTRWLHEGAETLVRIAPAMVSGREIVAVPERTSHALTEGWLLASCPACGSDSLRAVSDGDLANILCMSCMVCWHTELGAVYRVPPETCPGCALAELCTAANE